MSGTVVSGYLQTPPQIWSNAGSAGSTGSGQVVTPHVVDMRAKFEAMKGTTSIHDFREDLETLKRTLLKLDGRTNVLEVRTQGLHENPAEKRTAVAGESLLTVHSPERTRFHSSPLPPVTEVVAEVLKSARVDWKTEMDDRQAELGHKLFKDFGARLASHDDRLAIVELKLRALGSKLDRTQSSSDLESRRAQAQQEAGATLVPTIKESDVEDGNGDKLRETVKDLVAGNLQVVALDIQQLQQQADKIMDMVAKNNVSVHDHVHRIELMCKEQLAGLKDAVGEEVCAMIRKVQTPQQGAVTDNVEETVQQIIQKVVSPDRKLPDTSTDFAELALSSHVASNTQDETATQQQGNSKSSSCADQFHRSSSKSLEGKWAEDLRSTLLTYFRSELQDHVTNVLHRARPYHKPTPRRERDDSGPSSAKTEPPPGIDMTSPLDLAEDPLAVGRWGSVTLPACGPGTISVATPQKEARTPMTKLEVRAPPEAMSNGQRQTAASPTRSVNISASLASSNATQTQVYGIPPPASPAASPTLVQRQISHPVTSSPMSPDALASSLQRNISPTRVVVNVAPRRPSGSENVSTVQVSKPLYGAQSSPPPRVQRQISHPTKACSLTPTDGKAASSCLQFMGNAQRDSSTEGIAKTYGAQTSFASRVQRQASVPTSSPSPSVSVGTTQWISESIAAVQVAARTEGIATVQVTSPTYTTQSSYPCRVQRQCSSPATPRTSLRGTVHQ